MNYKALYRVFRPKTFDEIVGQKHIVSALKNQVISGNISHAYLFTGSRGTGKTSTAKIFARSISCKNSKDGEACLKCQLCKETFSDTSIDIVEIDAASNNGVEEIRELRENVKYAPVTGKYKVYIIDEVHMLSGSAFNALLKTLEEPPANVVFILATTEPQKLPETVISRCQRYDFERIDKEGIANRLEYICEQIGTDAETDALLTIADSVNGGLRDAISLLDQCVAFGGGKVDKGTVLNLLGKSGDEAMFTLCGMLTRSDGKGAVAAADELIASGSEPTVLASELIEHLHKLMVFKMAENPASITDTVKAKDYAEQAEEADINMLLRGIKLLSSAAADMKYSSVPGIILEVAIMEICTPKVSGDNLAVLQRLAALEKAVAHGVNPSVVGKEAKAEVKEPKETDFVQQKTDKKEVSIHKEEFIKDALKAENFELNEEMREQGGFGEKEYNEFLKKANKENKGVGIILKNSFFGGFKNGQLIIGYPKAETDIFLKAAQEKIRDIEKLIGNMGFKDIKVCVKMLEQNKTDELKELFGKNIVIKD